MCELVEEEGLFAEEGHMREALRVCVRYVSRFTVSPLSISIVFGGLFGFVFCLVCVFLGFLFGVCLFASHVFEISLV